MMKIKSAFCKASLAFALVMLLMFSVCVRTSAETNSSSDLNIAYCNLSFETDTHIMYAVKSNDANVRLLVWDEPRAEYTAGTQKALLEPLPEQTVINGDAYTVFKYTGLAAKQMTDDVYVRAYIDNGEGNVTYGNVHKYSILQYAYNKLGKTGALTTNAKLIDMLNSMLAYGASAQEYHGYKTDRLATDEFIQVKVTDGALSDGFKSGLYKVGTSVTISAPSVNSAGEAFAAWVDSEGTKIADTPEYSFTAGSENELYTPVYAPVSEGLAFTSKGNGTCYVSGIGSFTGTELNIPSTSPRGETVTAIGARAFIGNESITSVNIPDSVTQIGEYAFCECKSIKSVKLPSKIKVISKNAFSYCTALTEIIIPDSVNTISDYAFHGCSGVKSLNIPRAVATISGSAFSGCTALESITVDSRNPIFRSDGNCIIETASRTLITGCKTSVIPEDGSVTRIGDHAFYYCKTLSDIKLPEGITSIGNSAFAGCEGLRVVAFPDSLTGIGEEAFALSKGLEAIPFGEDSELTVIGADAFYGCEKLVNIRIPDKVTGIGDNAFIYCTSLMQVTFGSNSRLSRIGVAAFAGCTSLESIEVPTRVTEICERAFYRCTKLANVKMVGGVETIGDYAFSYCEALTDIDIPNSVKSIGSYVFAYCDNLTAAALGNSITSIGTYAFKLCENLAIIRIPASLASISADAFSECTSLATVVFEDTGTLKNIGSAAFFGCSNLKSVYINDIAAWCAVTFDGEYSNPLYHSGNLYLNNTLLTQIEFPAGITSISSYAFHGCDSLAAVMIPEGVLSIGSYAFYECSNLVGVTIPDSVTYIGEYAFSGTSDLDVFVSAESMPAGWSINWNTSGGFVFWGYDKESVSDGLEYRNNTSNGTCTVSGIGSFVGTEIRIPEISPDGYTVTGIDSGAFKDKTLLTTVVIPNTVKIINYQAFYYCTNLERVIFEENSQLTTIGQYTFAGCTALADIDIPDGVTSIGSSAFAGCTALAEINIPKTVTSIGNSAFFGCSELANITVAPENTVYHSDGNCIIETASKTLICGSKNSVIPPDGSVTSISESAFSNQSNLLFITIPDGVTSIGNRAFYACSSLVSITIPESITSIGNNAFFMCDNLFEVYNLSELSIKKGDSGNGYVGYYARDIYTSTDEPSKIFKTEDGYLFYNGVDDVYLLNYMGNETDLKLPEKYDGRSYKIYKNAFSKNTSVKTVEIPYGFTCIDASAFANCTSLERVIIPESVTEIGGNAFLNCTALKDVNIPNGLLSIGVSAFENCKSLESITIASSVTSIGASAFTYCEALKNITFEENSELTLIEPYAFNTCSSLVSISLPDSLTSLGYSAFSSCVKLATVTFGANSKLENIDGYAFALCSSLVKIIIPKSVVKIGNRAFNLCTSLSSVSFEDTSTWYVTTSKSYTGGTTVSVTSAGINASHFTAAHIDKYWYKK